MLTSGARQKGLRKQGAVNVSREVKKTSGTIDTSSLAAIKTKESPQARRLLSAQNVSKTLNDERSVATREANSVDTFSRSKQSRHHGATEKIDNKAVPDGHFLGSDRPTGVFRPNSSKDGC